MACHLIYILVIQARPFCQLSRGLRPLYKYSWHNGVARLTKLYIKLEYRLVTVDEVRKAIDRMKSKNSSGQDCISSKLVKFLKTAIANPLTLIINQGLKNGIFRCNRLINFRT